MTWHYMAYANIYLQLRVMVFFPGQRSGMVNWIVHLPWPSLVTSKFCSLMVISCRSAKKCVSDSIQCSLWHHPQTHTLSSKPVALPPPGGRQVPSTTKFPVTSAVCVYGVYMYACVYARSLCGVREGGVFRVCSVNMQSSCLSLLEPVPPGQVFPVPLMTRVTRAVSVPLTDRMLRDCNQKKMNDPQSLTT